MNICVSGAVAEIRGGESRRLGEPGHDMCGHDGVRYEIRTRDPQQVGLLAPQHRGGTEWYTRMANGRRPAQWASVSPPPPVFL